VAMKPRETNGCGSGNSLAKESKASQEVARESQHAMPGIGD